MKYTKYHFKTSIRVTRHSEGKDHYYQAECPICFRTEDATVLSSEEIAKATAVSKIVTHGNFSHKEDILDDDQDSTAKE